MSFMSIKAIQKSTIMFQCFIRRQKTKRIGDSVTSKQKQIIYYLVTCLDCHISLLNYRLTRQNYSCVFQFLLPECKCFKPHQKVIEPIRLNAPIEITTTPQYKTKA